MKIIHMIFLIEAIKKIKGNRNAATGNCVFVAGPTACRIPSAFLAWWPFQGKHENDQTHYLCV